MSFTDILALTDWEKIYLTETELGYRIDGLVWTQSNGDNSWYISHTEGEPTRVEEDGVAYTERVSLILCNANAGSWYWDSANQRLYIHTTGSDDPKDAYIILSYFWERITSSQDEEFPIIFNDHFYLPYMNSDDMPDITQEVSDYYEGGSKQSFGSIRYINSDGYFDARLTKYRYEFSKIIVKLGARGYGYVDFATIWIGYIGDIHWGDDEVEFEIEDFRSK